MVLRLEVHGKDGASEIGSALVFRRVGSTLLAVTAAHVVDGARSIEALSRVWPDEVLHAEVLGDLVDPTLDLAVIRVRFPEWLTASASRSSWSQQVQVVGTPRPTELVRFVGNPSYERWFISEASEINGIDDGFVSIHHHCDGGLSGGGIFDGAWRLFGMTLRRRATMLCEGIGIEKILSALDGWDLGYSWELATSGRSNDVVSPSGLIAVTTVLRSTTRNLPGETPLRNEMASVLFHRFPDVRWVDSRDRSAWVLDIEIYDYLSSSENVSTYGAMIRVDRFAARIRLVLRKPGGSTVLSEVVEIEATDHQGSNGWAGMSSAPIRALLEDLADEAEDSLSLAFQNEQN